MATPQDLSYFYQNVNKKPASSAYVPYPLPYMDAENQGYQGYTDPFRGQNREQLIGSGFTGESADYYLGTGGQGDPNLTSAIQRRLQLFPDLKPKTFQDELSYLQNLGLDQGSATRLAQGGYRDPDLIQAIQGVQQQYDPQQTALEQLKQQVEDLYNAQVGANQKFGELQQGNLNTIYDQLRGELETGQTKLADIYKTGTEQTQAAYNQANQATSASSQKLQDLISQRASSLGAQAATPDALRDLQASLADYQARTQGAGAGAVGNLATLGSQTQAIGQRGINASRQELAAKKSDLTNSIADIVSQLGLAKTGQEADIATQLATLKGQRGMAIRSGWQDIIAARTEAERQTALDQLAAQIQLGTLEIQGQRLGLDKEKMNQQFGLDSARLQLEQQRIDNDYNQGRISAQQRQDELDSLNAYRGGQLQLGQGRLTLDQQKAQQDAIGKNKFPNTNQKDYYNWLMPDVATGVSPGDPYFKGTVDGQSGAPLRQAFDQDFQTILNAVNQAYVADPTIDPVTTAIDIVNSQGGVTIQQPDGSIRTTGMPLSTLKAMPDAFQIALRYYFGR